MPEVLRKWFRGSRTSLTFFWQILLWKTGHQTIFSKCSEEEFFKREWVREVFEPLNHFLSTSGICSAYFSGSPTSGLSIGNNFRIMTGTDWILWQEIGLVIVFSRLKHETHVEYSTVWGLRGHFRYQKNFLRHFFKNPLPQFCRAWSGAQIKYPQHGHISWIESYKKIKVKKSKYPTWVPFWNNRLHLLTNPQIIQNDLFQAYSILYA